MPKGDFSKDKSERWLLTQQAGSILKLAGISGFTSWKVEESSLIAPRRLPDGLVNVTFPDRPKPVQFVIEIESYANTDADRQMYEDLLIARLELGVIPEGICVVLRPKGNVQVAGRFDDTSKLESSRIAASWRVVELWKLKAEELLVHGDIGITPWVPLAQIDGPPEPILQQCRDRIERDAPALQREVYLVVTAILGQLVHPVKLLEKIFAGATPMIESLFDNLEAEHAHKSILRVLTSRFGPMPDEIRSAIGAIFDLEALDTLLGKVGTCRDLEEFRTVLATVRQN